jgi:hypothetical protein
MDETDTLDNTGDDEPRTPPGDEDEELKDDSGEESLDQLIAKKTKEDEGSDDTDEESVLADQGEEQVTGTLPSNVKPKQSTEFTCRSCFLVKHHSQLANKKRMLCKDCA